MYLYHYFDRSVGPFRNLSDLPAAEARGLLNHIRKNWNDDGSHGPERYVEVHVWSDRTVSKYL